MSRMDGYRTTSDGDGVTARVRTGLLLIAAIVLAAVSVFFLDAAVRASTEGPRITVVVSSAPGLQPGSTVWVAGRPVGRVLSVGFRPPGPDGENVVIRAVLQRGADRVLRADARAQIRPSGLLGPVVVAIDPGTAGSPPWDLSQPFRSVDRSPDPDSVLVLSDSLNAAGRRLADRTADVRRLLAEGGGSLQRLRADGALWDGIRADAERVRDIRDRLPASSLGRLLSDSVLADRIRRIGDRWAVVAGRPDTALVEPEMSAGLDRTRAALASFGERWSRMSADLDAGEGTAGRALEDGELGRQVELLRARLDALTEALVKNPSLWLRVRVF